MSHPKTALITGASRGIGRGIALGLAGQGYNILINYAGNQAAAEETRAMVEWLKVEGHIVQADISLPDDRNRLVDETLAHFGRIDLLVNNAGVAPAIRADLLEVTGESFDRMININLKGPFFLTQLVARHWLERAGASGAVEGSDETISKPKIINITSISATTASIHRGDYCIAKAGLAMMTQLFAARLAGAGINVYEIRPGIIQTDMTGPVKEKYDDLIFNHDLTPIARWGQPADVAKAVVAVATDLLPFSTGEVINVDGGFHIRRL